MKQTDFEERVTAMTDDMYRVAAGMLFRYADRQDAVQECIWKAWRQLDRLRDESAFRPWLMRILVNECRNLQRKGKHEVAAEYIEISSLENAYDDCTRDEILHDAMQKLPEKMRLTLILYYMDGFSIQETARILRIPEGTVKSRLRIGRMRLKEMLGKEV